MRWLGDPAVVDGVEERVFEVQEAGATDYVRKARVPDDLCAALAAALRKA